MQYLGRRQIYALMAGLGALTIGFGWAGSTTSPSARPAVDLQLPPEMLLCVTHETLCLGQPLPPGFPCTCADPLHGVQRGEVMTRREAERELLRRPAWRLDPDAGETMLGMP